MYERARFDEQIGEALLEEIPAEWCGAVLVLRVEAEPGADGVRCRQAVRGPGDEVFRPGPATREAVTALLAHLATRDEVFRGANYAVATAAGEWALTAEFTFDRDPPRAWTLPSLAEKHALASCARQLRLGRKVKHAVRELDLLAGELRYPALDIAATVHLLGTTSDDDDTWTWGWAASEVPQERRVDGTALRRTGVVHAIPELLADVVPLDASRGHKLAAIGAALTGASAYVRCAEDGVAQFVAVSDEQLTARPLLPTSALEETARTMLDTGWVLNVRRALRHGLAEVGGAFVAVEDGAFLGTAPDGTPFRLDVDANGKLARLTTT